MKGMSEDRTHLLAQDAQGLSHKGAGLLCIQLGDLVHLLWGYRYRQAGQQASKQAGRQQAGAHHKREKNHLMYVNDLESTL